MGLAARSKPRGVGFRIREAGGDVLAGKSESPHPPLPLSGPKNQDSRPEGTPWGQRVAWGRSRSDFSFCGIESEVPRCKSVEHAFSGGSTARGHFQVFSERLGCLQSSIWRSKSMGSNSGIGALPILICFRGDRDVHSGYEF